ncbi:hypothetical protein [Microcoleus sp. N3A4]
MVHDRTIMLPIQDGDLPGVKPLRDSPTVSFNRRVIQIWVPPTSPLGLLY